MKRRMIFGLTMMACAMVPTASAMNGAPEIAAAAEEQATPASATVSFKVTLPESFPDGRATYSGRVYVALQRPGRAEPRRSMHSWFGAPPVAIVDVTDAAPGSVITLDSSARTHPIALTELDDGPWQAQAILRLNPDSARAGMGAGDLVSDVVDFEIGDVDDTDTGTGTDADADGGAKRARFPIALSPTREVEGNGFEESERVRLVEIRSDRLSDFHGRDVMIRAGVVLPEETEDAEESDGDDPASAPRAVIYHIGGFGGTHHGAFGFAFNTLEDERGAAVLHVVPDPTCYRGHSVFADSANNGPWGAALVEELIPYIDATFNGAGADHRYVTGVSSGGWSSAWLQIQYPDQFAGAWSFAPDPVDFRDFQQINLYEDGSNMYVDETGANRPVARRGEEVMLEYRPFVEREDMLGPGGQIHSFEAVFSPRRPDGTPLPIFDRVDGTVDTEATKTWEPYDINLVLSRNWDTLKSRLDGRLHIWGGGRDNFYLEGAVRRLRETLLELDPDREHDILIEVIEDMGHSAYRPGIEDMRDTVAERWKAAFGG